MSLLNILLLEDQPDIQNWISDILKETFPGHIIFKADDIKEAQQHLANQNFTIALLDINLPDGSGLEILKAIKQKHAQTLCVMSTIFDDHDNIFSALQLGADGYIIKSGSRENFKSSLLNINKGEPPLSPKVASMMMNYFHNHKEPENNLTDRQNQILKMIAQGLQNKEIATELDLSVYTIMDHIKRLYDKLNISSRAQAAIKAQQLGLL
ncbi:MAG: response regulator transcription factor [Gammaproteobacteria bacterium]|nr:response regulator transcription factor [Gammaproteobacteria bacterium]